MKPPRRSILVGGIALVVVALNVAGILRYPGGPLRESSADGWLWLDTRPADQGSNVVGNSQPSDWANAGADLTYGLLSLRNGWPVAVTVEAITPIDPTPGLVVEHAYVLRPGMPSGSRVAFGPVGAGPDAATLAREFVALPAVIEPRDGVAGDSDVLLVIRSDQVGGIGWSALAVDYRMGPVSFRVVQHLGLRGCLGPLPPGTECPAAE